MDKVKKEAIIKARTFDELLDAEYGNPGTPERDQFDADAAAFCLAETLKEERLRAGLTQEQLEEGLMWSPFFIWHRFNILDANNRRG